MSPFVKSLAFWKALTYVVAVIWFYFDPAKAATQAMLLGLIQAVLQFINIVPELRARGFVK